MQVNKQKETLASVWEDLLLNTLTKGKIISRDECSVVIRVKVSTVLFGYLPIYKYYNVDTKSGKLLYTEGHSVPSYLQTSVGTHALAKLKTKITDFDNLYFANVSKFK